MASFCCPRFSFGKFCFLKLDILVNIFDTDFVDSLLISCLVIFVLFVFLSWRVNNFSTINLTSIFMQINCIFKFKLTKTEFGKLHSKENVT